MILLFQNWQGDLRVISNPSTKDEVLKDIRKFCNERNYEIPYIRFWDKQLDDGTKKRTYDVGSHHEFFVLEGVKKNVHKN